MATSDARNNSTRVPATWQGVETKTARGEAGRVGRVGDWSAVVVSEAAYAAERLKLTLWAARAA